MRRQKAAPDAKTSATDSDRWCAPELDALSNDVCWFAAKTPAPGPRTLVVFLHGVTQPGSGWQWTFQRAAARIAESRGLTVIMPRGRRGNGPKGEEDWWAWPTSEHAQETIEADVLAEWSTAQAELEQRAGQKFERVWIFGFSNGAYYATSLALRGRLSADGDTKHPIADGFAVFAGGSGASYLKAAAAHTTTRPRFFVAWGGKDPAHGDQVELAALLRNLSWPSRSDPSKNAGHTATDKQLSDAVAFLNGETGVAPISAADATAKTTSMKHTRKRSRKATKKPVAKHS